MTTWMLLGWPVVAAFGLIAWANRQPEDAASQAAEDDEQAAYLAAWMNRRNAVARGDKRGQGEAVTRLQDALHAKLRAELRH